MTDTTITAPSGAAPDSAPAPVTTDVSTPDATPKTPAARDANGRFAGTQNEPEANAEAAADAPEAVESDPLKVEAEAVKDKDGKRKSANERIAQITAQKHAALNDAAYHRQNAEHLAAQLKALQSEPETGDFSIDMRKAVKTENLEQAAQNYRRANAQVQQAMIQEFGAKIDAARASIPNLDQALTVFDTLKISDAACDFIASSDKAAELAYYLGQNVQDARRIEALPVPRQTAELARIEARLTAPKPKTVSTAPKPAPILGGGANPMQFDASRSGIADVQAALKKAGVIR